MFQELHRNTVDLISTKVSNYLFGNIEAETELSDDSTKSEYQKQLDGDDRVIYDYIFEQEQKINMIESDERIQSLNKCMSKLHVLEEQQKQCSKNLHELREVYSSVAESTSSLHNACDQMMFEQTQLAAANERLKTNLYYYQQYDWIMQKLQTSRLSLTGTLFTQILSTIHECISYLKAHSHEKEAELYLYKYEQCLSKSLTAIKASVFFDLEACREEVFYRQARHFAGPPAAASAEGAVSTADNATAAAEERNPVSAYVNDDMFALLYGVFGVKANTVRNALSQAHRFFADTPEYETVLGECEAEYFSIRDRLLRPIVEATIRSLTARHANSSCNLARDGCVFLLRLCDDEFRLYKNFFVMDTNEGAESGARTGVSARSGMHSGIWTPMTPFSLESWFGKQTQQQISLPFDNFIESLCTILYDTLRPLVITNPHLETLTQLCTLIKVEMIEERCGRLMPAPNSASTSSTVGGGMIGFGRTSADFVMNPRVGFARVMGELVGDIVERIVYRASLFAQSDILNYSPAPGDLCYPERLIMMNDIKSSHQEVNSTPVIGPKSSETNSTANRRRDSSTTVPQKSAVDLHCLWYPTVRRTVMCLSKLYKCLDPTVFLNISSELLEACCQSLEMASEKIRVLPIDPAKAFVKSAGRMLDAKLFLVKHLLILREQTSPYRNLASRQYRKQQSRAFGAAPPGRLSRTGSITSLSPAVSQSHTSDGDGLASQQQFDYSLDLSRYKNSVFEFLSAENRGRWFELSSNNAVLSLLLATPVHMSEFQTDSRRIIEAHLRRHCHELIRFVTNILTGSLPHVAAKIDEFEEQNEKKKLEGDSREEEKSESIIRQRTIDFTGFDELTPKSLNDVVSMAFKTIKQNWPMIRSTFALYIGSHETEEILLKPNRHAIAQLFSKVACFTQKYFSHEQCQIASVPEQEQVWLILNSGGTVVLLSPTSNSKMVADDKAEILAD